MSSSLVATASAPSLLLKEIDGLEIRLNSLSANLSSLQERLTPVRLRSPEKGIAGETAEAQKQMSPVMAAINQVGCHIDYLALQITELENSLEV